MNNESDENLAQLIKNGDTKAAEILYLRYRGKVASFVRNQILNLPYHGKDLEDFVGDIFGHLFKKINTYDRNKGNFSSWFWSLETNFLTSEFRKFQKNKYGHTVECPLKLLSLDAALSENEELFLKDVLEDRNLSPEEQIMVKEIVNSIYRIIDDIENESYHLAVVFRWLFQMSCKEISKLLGRPISTIKSDIARGVKIIQEKFEKIWGEDFDPEEITKIAKEGGFIISESDLDRIKDKKAKEALYLKVFERKSYSDIAKKLKISVKKTMNLIMQSIQILLKYKIKRAVAKQGFIKSSRGEAEKLSMYIDMLFQGLEVEKPVRAVAGKESRELTKLKKTAKMLYTLLGARYLNKEIVHSLGELIEKRISKIGLSYNDITKKLNIDEHRLMEIINGRIKPAGKEITQISKILKVPRKRVKNLSILTSPTEILDTRKTRTPINWKNFDKKMIEKIHQIMRKK